LIAGRLPGTAWAGGAGPPPGRRHAPRTPRLRQQPVEPPERGARSARSVPASSRRGRRGSARTTRTPAAANPAAPPPGRPSRQVRGQINAVGRHRLTRRNDQGVRLYEPANSVGPAIPPVGGPGGGGPGEERQHAADPADRNAPRQPDRATTASAVGRPEYARRKAGTPEPGAPSYDGPAGHAALPTPAFTSRRGRRRVVPPGDSDGATGSCRLVTAPAAGGRAAWRQPRRRRVVPAGRTGGMKISGPGRRRTGLGSDVRV
jgi:hypothetical protein